MKNSPKWKRPRSSLRERLVGRKERREQPYYSSFGQDFSLQNIPAVLVKQLRENMFQKTVAAIVIVICLGVFSLFNMSFTNRVVDYVHYLTETDMEPVAFIEAAKPVMQSIRNFSWKKDSQAPLPEDDEEPVNTEPQELAAPVNGVLSSPFGTRVAPDGNGLEMHYGIDVTAEAGSPVYAALSGTVTLVKEHEVYGTTIYIRHADDMVTIYGRVADSLVVSGDEVMRGQQIAKVAEKEEGESHLHFEIWEEKQPVDPETLLTGTDAVANPETEVETESDTDIN